MFTKNIIFLLMLISSQLSAMPVSLIKNRTMHPIIINAIAIKARSVARIKNLEIPFTTWLLHHREIIDGKEYCPQNFLQIIAGSLKAKIWQNELGIWAIIIDESMPLSPNDQKPLLLRSFYANSSVHTVNILVNEETIELQC